MLPADGILTFNGGSSSIRFALFQAGTNPQRGLSGKIDRIGSKEAQFEFTESDSQSPESRKVGAFDFAAAASFLLDWLEARGSLAAVGGIGHRVVHGMRHAAPERVTPELVAELRGYIPYDPEHLPLEIELIEACHRRHPHLPQVVCFDTAFHAGMPRVAKMLPIPRSYEAKGVHRYGFHGLSYAYLLQELARRGDPAAVRGRVILAHLGNGASLAAVRDGQSLDTSMGFTPASGLMMGTRSGDLDPGLVGYLARTEHMTAAQFHELANHRSGLLGVSETGSDVRDLLAAEAEDARAAEAVALFCYQAKKWIGAFAAVLGGLDTLVFAGGIGENAPVIRARICAGLEFLGIAIDDGRNRENADVISPAAGRVAVRVVRTDEEFILAQTTGRVLGLERN